MRWLKRVVVGFFALVGVMTVSLSLLAVWVGASLLAPSSRAVPETTALELDLTKAPAEGGSGGGIVELLSPKRMTLRQIEEALERAGRDDRVKGLVVRLGESFSYATNEELRDAITAFRKRGKFTIAFAESYGEVGSGSGGYPIAAACEEVWLQPSGGVNLVGVIAETPFLRGTLDKLGIVPRADKREEYKNALDELTDTAYSPAFKESLQSILGSLYDQLTQAVADGRGLGADATKALIDRGPFLAEEAVAAKLVDRLGYHDEARDAARRRAGPGGKLVQLPDYFRATRDGSGEGPVIAMIAASGPIVSGSSGFDDAFGVTRIGADTLSDTIDEAVRASDVAALLLRIDSPGGSYVASDTIWRAVNRAKAAGKPVIVSMGGVAASGGYFIAVPASKIVAEPGTLTGSIGVFGGKLVIKGLLEKLGISVDAVQFGANAAIWSSDQDFTPEGWNRLEASLDAVYKDFTSKVVAARGLDASRIPEIAKGRVFTGAQARKLGLVDALGGFPQALELAREALHLKPEEPVQLREYPPRGREFRELLHRLFAGEGIGAASLASLLARELAAPAAALRPLIAELPALTRPGEAWLLIPPLEVR
ncbi:MAG TPA: signal peptide peptidase SppA [Alphaproteobacteria bacterium]|nr:signal peptide peptidase SppA [Alphaproteobacteria bacterium]